MIPIARPIIGEEELAAVKEVLASGMLAQGPKVKAFESAFAKDVGRKHGIAVANGTEALHIALAAHDIGGGNEVLIPPLTFFATASTVLQCGAKPVFVDVARDSYNLDPAKVATVITRKTAEVMRVDSCSIYLLDTPGEHLVLKATTGLAPEAVGRSRLRLGEGLTGWAARSGWLP